MTPTESSAGATTLRASVSASSRKAPPPSTAAGITRRLSGPSNIRRTCGTISPTKPMGPTKATTAEVRSAAPAKTRRLSRSASTPSCWALSSPRASRLSGRACPTTSQRPTAVRAAKTARRSEEHTSELQSHVNLVCRILLEKKKTKRNKEIKDKNKKKKKTKKK